jgi:hypothetical protein
MANWKEDEEESYRDFLYIEEIDSNEGRSRRLTGISTSQTVQHLKRTIASDLKNPQCWNSLQVAFAGQALSDRKCFTL